MAQRQLSRTLPKNFTFPSLSADEPKTPERPSASIDVPPPPRHSFSSYRLPRVRVRSGTDVCAQMDLDLFRFQGLSDVPLPSIELPQQQSATIEIPFSDDTVNDDRYLAPPRQRMEFKTPPAQIRSTPLDTPNPWSTWDQTPIANSITRPGSACSDRSDSSIESVETFASRPSEGGSCTSAESDAFDPYFPLEVCSKSDMEMESPALPKKHNMLRGHTKDSSWSREMDNHLWNTYQMYLQDPSMTPFKMTPGSIPPLGVTSRVARRARRTWEKKLRITDSVAPRSADRSGSSTPKAVDGAGPAWPKSDAKTRKRLKLLCRRKFCIMPHYQRMMQSRSPEPLADMLSASSESRVRDFSHNNSMIYGTRDLGASLVTGLDQTPLMQLAEPSIAAEPQAEWFNNPVHLPPAEPVAQPSTQHLSVETAHNIPRLGSPFVYNTWGPGGSARQTENLPAPARTVHAPSSRLRRNTQLQRTPRDTDDVFSSDGAMDKDPSDEQVQRRLENYIRDRKFQSMGHGRVRIRNRGATTTGASAPKDVDQLFSPPWSLNSSNAEETTPAAKPPANPLLNIQGENIKRLGSPFKLEGGFNKRREAPGRFVRHAPSLSDPFSSGGLPSYVGPPANPSPIQEQAKPTGPHLQDPFEEGLTDAERIRRQLLNRSFMRN